MVFGWRLATVSNGIPYVGDPKSGCRSAFAASADPSQVSLISCTGRWSIRVFQMLFAGNTRQSVPGTSAAEAGHVGANRAAIDSSVKARPKRLLTMEASAREGPGLTGTSEPAVGFEPTTCCLQDSCSTPELRRRTRSLRAVRAPNATWHHSRIEHDRERGRRVERPDATTHRERNQDVARLAREPRQAGTLGADDDRDPALERWSVVHAGRGALVEPDDREPGVLQPLERS